MKLYKYSLADLVAAVKTSTSMRQALIKLDVTPYGGNYDVLRKAIACFQLDTSHFTGQAWNKGLTISPRRPLERYLNNEIPIQSFKLRNRLLKENVFKHQCAMCNKITWLQRPIPLELDHINGNRQDNSLTNLRLLCPNCHALTPTYRSKNRVKA